MYLTTPALAALTGSFTITATADWFFGETDTSPGAAYGYLSDVDQVASVAFYQSTSSVVNSVSGATEISGAVTSDGEGNWSLEVSGDGDFLSTASRKTFYAQATDQFGNVSDPVGITYIPEMTDPNDTGTRTWNGNFELDYGSDNGNIYETAVSELADPAIADLAVAQLASADNPLADMRQISAGSVSDGQGNNIESVDFYLVPGNGSTPFAPSDDNYVATAESADGDSWNTILDTSGLTGDWTFYAVAQDSDGVVGWPSARTVTFNRPSMVDVSAAAAIDSSTNALQLSLASYELDPVPATRSKMSRITSIPTGRSLPGQPAPILNCLEQRAARIRADMTRGG